MPVKKTRWEKSFAQVWTNYIPPARPSAAEIVLYTKYLRKLQNAKKDKIKLLVLGSTPEFRDWGFQEGLDVTVIDYNKENNGILKTFMRHQNAKENFIEESWKDMKFENEFDIIIGDHAISVLLREDLPDVLKNIARALKKDGIFITKHYLGLGKNRTLEEIIKSYYAKFSNYHIYLIASTEIVVSGADRKTNYFDFGKALKELKNLCDAGLLKKEDYATFEEYGWANMKFNLYVPTQGQWEKALKPHLNIHKIDYSQDIYAKEMPIYILKKK